jgi:hypothetical protein
LAILVTCLASLSCGSAVNKRPAVQADPLPTVWVSPAAAGTGEVCQLFAGTQSNTGLLRSDSRSCGGLGRVCPSCRGSAKCKSCFSGRVTLEGTPQTSMIACNSCGGAGGFKNFVNGGFDRCWACNGSGRTNIMQRQSMEAQCITCSGSGECRKCQGSGKGEDVCVICQGSGRVTVTRAASQDGQPLVLQCFKCQQVKRTWTHNCGGRLRYQKGLPVCDACQNMASALFCRACQVYLWPSSVKGQPVEQATMSSMKTVGIGVRLEWKEKTVFITKVVAGGPAEKVELKFGDQILSIDGKPVENLSEDEVSSLLRGKAGDPVTVTVRSRGDQSEREVTIVRAVLSDKD